jgi:hypothetical protein
LAPPARPVYRSPWRGLTIPLLALVVLAGVFMLWQGNALGWIGVGIGFVAVLALYVIAQRAAAAYQRALPRWLHQKARYDALYYCQRHNVVFIAGTTEAVPPEQARQLLER